MSSRARYSHTQGIFHRTKNHRLKPDSRRRFHIPDQTRRDLPISLLQILTKLLNRTPSARPSASDVLAELASEHLTVCKVSKTVELFHAEVRHEKSFDGSNVALIPRPSKIGLKAQADQIKVFIFRLRFIG